MQPGIIFEDDSLLVVDKPAFLTVNRSDTTVGEKTLQDFVEQHVGLSAFQKASVDSDFYKRSGIVHRIDKETSGILLVAKTPEMFLYLQEQFKIRRVKKVYTALVHGKLAMSEGEISVPIGRLPWNRKRFGVLAGGREAVTKYKVLSIKYLGKEKQEEPFSLLQLYPQTGRTHQIRVHLKHIGHPIVSDPFYGGRKTARDDRKHLPRVFLHASGLSFIDPKTKEERTFSSELPQELKDFFQSLHD